MLLHILSAALALSTPVVEDTDGTESEWLSWLQAHNKTYGTTEEHDKRRGIWLQSRAEVLRHNADTTKSWSMKLNAFADLSWAEFKAFHLMDSQNCSATHKSSGWKAPANVAVPPSIDWRQKITPWPGDIQSYKKHLRKQMADQAGKMFTGTGVQ